MHHLVHHLIQQQTEVQGEIFILDCGGHYRHSRAYRLVRAGSWEYFRAPAIGIFSIDLIVGFSIIALARAILALAYSIRIGPLRFLGEAKHSHRMACKTLALATINCNQGPGSLNMPAHHRGQRAFPV